MSMGEFRLNKAIAVAPGVSLLYADSQFVGPTGAFIALSALFLTASAANATLFSSALLVHRLTYE